MPCYSVQTCNVELLNADLGLLQKALENQGFKVTRNGNNLSFSKGKMTGTYSGKRLSIQGEGANNVDTDAIKRAYSEQVILKKKKEMQAKGWDVYKEKGEYVFKKRQQLGY